MGTTKKVEQSIQNAYLKGQSFGKYTMTSLILTRYLLILLTSLFGDLLHTFSALYLAAAIQLSEHFVYIENQFFITS